MKSLLDRFRDVVKGKFSAVSEIPRDVGRYDEVTRIFHAEVATDPQTDAIASDIILLPHIILEELYLADAQIIRYAFGDGLYESFLSAWFDGPATILERYDGLYIGYRISQMRFVPYKESSVEPSASITTYPDPSVGEVHLLG